MADRIGFRAWTAQIFLPAYIISLFLPALYAGGSPIGGATLFFFGWLGVTDKINIAWFANPACFVAFILFIIRRYKQACWWSSAAVLMALDTFRADLWWSKGSGIPIDSVGFAFYIWEFSIICLATGSFFGWRSSGRSAPGEI